MVVDGDGARRCPCLVVVSLPGVGASLSRARVVRDCYDACFQLRIGDGDGDWRRVEWMEL